MTENVCAQTFDGPINLAHLAGLTQLRHLDVGNIDATAEGFRHPVVLYDGLETLLLIPFLGLHLGGIPGRILELDPGLLPHPLHLLDFLDDDHLVVDDVLNRIGEHSGGCSGAGGGGCGDGARAPGARDQGAPGRRRPGARGPPSRRRPRPRGRRRGRDGTSRR